MTQFITKIITEKVNLIQNGNPLYHIFDKTAPSTCVIKNQLDGSTSKVHAELLRLANIDWDEIKSENPTTYPMRKKSLCCPS